ncbi:MAG: hypothetical protein CFE21_13945 [Bacteroidetes bacterium B1(2017)]|nr:MAG: hypothetical protein CFE21_13945 [Bacteroidetes bacterium B1(2017)]
MGVCLNIKWFPGYTKQYFTSDFKNDFNSSFIHNQPNYADSMAADLLWQSVNGNSNHFFQGTSNTSYGIFFTPFPQKYGSLTFEMNKGISNLFVFRNNPKGLFNSIGNHTPPVLMQYNKFQFLASVYPLRSFVAMSSQSRKYLNYFNRNFLLCVYYERYKLENTKIQGDIYQASITKFLDKEFMEKYSVLNRFGIKVGLSIN